MPVTESYDTRAAADVLATDYIYLRASASASGSRDKKFAFPAMLRSFFGLTIAADKLVYGNGANTFTTTDFTTLARTLLGRATAALMRVDLGIITATAALDFGSISTLTSADLTITVTGAAVGDAVHLGLPAAPMAGIAFNGFVSAANTVTVRAMNYTAGPVDPASATYRATVIKTA